jgi:hypothetical protein
MSTHLHLELLNAIYRMVPTLLCEFDCNDLVAHWRHVCQLGALDPLPLAVYCCIHLTHCADNLLGARLGVAGGLAVVVGVVWRRSRSVTTYVRTGRGEVEQEE